MTERDVRRWILGSFSSARMARVEGHIFVLGLGGSGTNDGGMGMAQALGVRFLDEEEHEITFRKDWGYSGGSLKYVEKLDTTLIHPDIANTKFLIVSDVNNPL